jgi:hypothetical protein
MSWRDPETTLVRRVKSLVPPSGSCDSALREGTKVV